MFPDQLFLFSVCACVCVCVCVCVHVCVCMCVCVDVDVHSCDMINNVSMVQLWTLKSRKMCTRPVGCWPCRCVYECIQNISIPVRVQDMCSTLWCVLYGSMQPKMSEMDHLHLPLYTQGQGMTYYVSVHLVHLHHEFRCVSL